MNRAIFGGMEVEQRREVDDGQDVTAPDDWLTTIYLKQRESFLHWARSRYQMDDASLLDVFQDAIIVLYQSRLRGKLEEVSALPEAYLFGICRNLIKKRHQRDTVHDLVEEDQLSSIDESLLLQHDLTSRQKEIQLAFASLGENCRQILTLYYYHEFSMEAIMHQLDYRSENAVKSRKYQCLQKLKSIFMKAES